jgi:hypothetical protein
MIICHIQPEELVPNACKYFTPYIEDKLLVLKKNNGLLIAVLAHREVHHSYADSENISYNNMEHFVRKIFRNTRSIGGGSITASRNNPLLIRCNHFYYRALPQGILDTIKHELLTHYKRLFPKLRLRNVKTAGDRKEED